MNVSANVDRSSIITFDDILDGVPRDHRIHNWISEQCRFAVTEHSPSLSHTQHLHSDSLSSIESTIPAIRADSPLLGFPSASECNASHDPLHFPSPTYARDLPQLEPVVEVVQHSPHETDERRIENLVKTLSLDKVCVGQTKARAYTDLSHNSLCLHLHYALACLRLLRDCPTSPNR
jgi:hypothetical protein